MSDRATDAVGGSPAAPATIGEPSVVASHLDIVYRVLGARSSAPAEEEASGLRRAWRASREVGAVREVHAVRDVSFVARHGERIGVIGRNGSGKSTLLRAVAGLIPPSGGEVWAAGTPSLLGVKAALLKNLSGARNIEVGCLALGMTKAEIAERFDDIVALADIGDAIDLPMSTYSSGMGARLRFAISTAAQPEVLIVDEALATGDAAFKERSQRRIDELTAGAGTLFLVSHSASSIRAMCDRALWMDAGTLIADGPVEEVLGAYQDATGGRRRRAPAAPPPFPHVSQIGTKYTSTAAARTSALVTQPEVPVIFLSSRADPAGALAAAPGAARLGGPILFSSTRKLPPAAAVEISRVNPGRVEILAGGARVREEVAADLEENGVQVVARDERTRLAQVAAMCRESTPDGAGGVLVLSDHEDRNIVAAALRALHLDAPLLLLRPSDSTLPTVTIKEIERIRPVEVDIYSDTDAPEAGVEDTVRALGVERVVRTQVDPTVSAVEASRARFPGGAESILVCPRDTVAELVTATYGAFSGAQPLLLVSEDGVEPEVAAEIRRLAPEQITVVDVEGALPDPVLTELSELVDSS